MQHPSPTALTGFHRSTHRVWGLLLVLLGGVLGMSVGSGALTATDGLPPDGETVDRTVMLQRYGLPGGAPAVCWPTEASPIDVETEASGDAPAGGTVAYGQGRQPRSGRLGSAPASNSACPTLSRYLLLCVLRL